MSGATIGWVYTHSPYNGATFAVHLALGDAANDLHGHEIWASQTTLAEKARTTRGTCCKALGQLVDDGYLELLEDNSKANRPNRYRLLMPADVAVVWEPKVRAPSTPKPLAEVRAPATEVRAPDTPGVSRARTNPKGTQEEPKEGLTRGTTVVAFDPDEGKSDGAAFDAFWAAYPRNADKGRARKAWPRAVRTAGSAGPIIEGALRFAADPNRADEFTPHAATWLNGERWGDDPLPARTGRGGQDARAAARRAISNRRDGQARVVHL